MFPSYDDQDRKSTAFIKEDNMKLQVLVNKVLRSTGSDRENQSLFFPPQVENFLLKNAKLSLLSTLCTDHSNQMNLFTAT